MSDPYKNTSRSLNNPPAGGEGGGKSLFQKIRDKHIVKQIDGGPSVLYIDKHFIHEVTSPQAFQGLEKRGLKVFRPQQVVATAYHNVPTLNQHLPIKDGLSRNQVQQLIENCARHDFELYGVVWEDANTEMEVNFEQQTIKILDRVSPDTPSTGGGRGE